ncbi:MAG: amidohydrolase family protein [Candidatus Doudnabacteria bacterium]
MFSVLIKQATVIDGTGQAPQVFDVAIENNQIVAIKPEINSLAHSVINAKGLVLTPGFIDTQNHSDSYWQIFNQPSLESLVLQGYTTAIMGSSGTSLAPLLSNESILSVQKWESTTGLNFNWQTFGEFAQTLKTQKFGVNLLSMVGYGTIRRGLLGDKVINPNQEDLLTILKTVENSFQEGAVGVSVGLGYSHETSVSSTELVALAGLCVKYNKVLAVSLKDESGDVSEAVREITALAEQTGAKIKISHLKVRYQNSETEATEVLSELEAVWHRGALIHFDTYPYNFSWQPLYSYLPAWAIIGGRKQLLLRIQDQETRPRIIEALRNSHANLESLIVASTTNQMTAIGKTISSIAKDLEMTSEEAILNLIEHGGTQTLVFGEFTTEQNLHPFLNHSLGFIATNGGGFSLLHQDKLIHPRCFGSAPKFLRQIIDNQEIPLNEAIRKMTEAPAKKFNLGNKGQITLGAHADLVLFDPKEINSQANISNPYQAPTGIKGVWVNGQQVVKDGQFLDILAGKFLT